MNSRDVSAQGRRFPVDSLRVPHAAAAVLFVIPLLIFVGLAAAVVNQDDFEVDRAVMMWVSSSASTPWLTGFMQNVTHLGGLIVPMVAIAVALVLCWQRRWGAAFFVVAAEYGASRINTALKSVFERTRPDFWEHLSVENTHSFPSGHSMASMALASALLVLAWGTRYWWAAFAAAVVYVVVVGASRVYLGVHFPSDVLAAWCVSLIWVGFLVVVLRLLARAVSGRAPRAPEPAD